jgi:hypothetical protein
MLYFPYPITETENGVILYYFISDTSLINKKPTRDIEYQFISYGNKDYCLFDNKWAVSVDLLSKVNFKEQKYLFFMRYGMDSVYSTLLFVFEMDEDFIVNYKAFQSFLKYKESFEKETASSTKEEAVNQ